MGETDEYINRKAAIKGLLSLEPVYRRVSPQRFVGGYKAKEVQAMIQQLPAADVVARDCYDRILAENDMMRNQLAEIGKKVGDNMDDLRPVTKGHWLWDRGTRTCSNCGQMKATYKKDNFCSCCGADNREVKTK